MENYHWNSVVAVEFCDLKYSTNTMAFTLMPGLVEVGFLVDCEGVYMFCIMLLYNISKFGAVVNLTETFASSQVYVSKRGKTIFSKIFNSFFGVLYSIIISQELTKL